MAVKYMMDEEARDQLDRRALTGKECIAPANDGGEELETAARDAVSDILTALFGPAGYCAPSGNESKFSIVLDEERGGLARTFLDLAYESWEGDAEDYTAKLVTVDNPLLGLEQQLDKIDHDHIAELWRKYKASSTDLGRGFQLGRLEEYASQNDISWIAIQRIRDTAE